VFALPLDDPFEVPFDLLPEGMDEVLVAGVASLELATEKIGTFEKCTAMETCLAESREFIIVFTLTPWLDA
jgi:hypothetical protein